MTDSLFDLKDSYMELLEMADDEDVDAEAWYGSLESIEGEIEAKAEDYCKLITRLKAEIAAERAEQDTYAKTIKAMKSHTDAKEAKMERLRTGLANVLLTIGQPKYTAGQFKLSAKVVPQCRWLGDLRLNDIPKEYVNTEKVFSLKLNKNNESYINKELVMEKLANGETLPFAEVVEKASLTMR